MAQYLVSYLDGETEMITAANLEPSGNQYIAWAGDGSAAAYIPVANVRSVVRQDEAVDPCGAPAGAICVHDVYSSRKAVTG